MTDDSRRFGVIGLGNMGLPMARRLHERGWQVVGYDLDDGARATFVSLGGQAVPSIPEGAGDVVILMLPSSDVVEAVVLRSGLLEQMSPGSLVVDMGSSEPLRTRALATVLGERGIRLIDAPVSGGVSGAENGSLTIMVGGSAPDFEEVRGVLEVLGRATLVGPIGAGHALKALNNLLSATHLWATSEAILVGERFGLDPAVMVRAINASSGRSGSTDNKWPNFIIPGTFDSGFGLRLMVKDMKIAAGLAEELSIPFTLGEDALALWADAADRLAADADHTEIVRVLTAGSKARAQG